jgi:hypothetical protein
MASATATTIAPPLSLEEVLHVYLLCFDAAADAFPQAPAAYALPYHHPSVPVKIWKIWSTEDLKTKPPKHLDRFTFLPPGLNDALARKDMCDWFCLLLEEEVSKKMGELFYGRARWLMYWPKIDFLLAWRGGMNQLTVPMHSVLLIETGDGREMIMDGTLRQYLWESSTWLETWEECSARRVDRQDKREDWMFPQEEIKYGAGHAAARVAGGFWAAAFWRLTHLFKDLDWEELRSLRTVERIEHVKRMAGERFAHLHEEALRFG